jgi:hypothetical protein
MLRLFGLILVLGCFIGALERAIRRSITHATKGSDSRQERTLRVGRGEDFFNDPDAVINIISLILCAAASIWLAWLLWRH